VNNVNNNKDFREIILSQRGKKPVVDKTILTTIDYMKIILKAPKVACFAPGRIYDMIMKHGIKETPDDVKTRGYEDLVSYNFFDNKIYGTLEPIHDLMRFMKAAARRTETGKRILLMVGPVSSGKSTIAGLFKKGLEKDDTPIYVIDGCPIHEEPLHLIPEENRKDWEKRLGIKIEGFLCPHCQQRLDEEFTDENGIVRWEDVPVKQIEISEQRRKCIGTFQPSDPKSQDITELIGRVNMSKIARFGETDPRAYQFDGELQVANRGLIEYIEILKADVKFHYILITAAQEQTIKAPGFPQMYIDSLILSHTNQTEFDIFASDKKNEALHDRMYPVYVPWNLRVDDEIKIYEKMINESDFCNVHIAPYTLKMAASFAVLTRLVPDNKCSSIVHKMKLYNREVIDEFTKIDIDVKQMYERGREKGEGMSGISPRFIINALNVALGMKEDKSCINPIDIIRALRNNFGHQIGMKNEDIERYLGILVGDKSSILSEYTDIAKKEVNMSFLYAYEEQAEELFNRYMINVTAFVNKEEVDDMVTGEKTPPDEILMRALEDIIRVPENSKEEFRNGIFVQKARCLEQKEPFNFSSYEPLKEAIEKKLMSDLKNVVQLSIAITTSTSKKVKRRRSAALKSLKERGYCDHCGQVLLSFVGDVMRKAN